LRAARHVRIEGDRVVLVRHAGMQVQLDGHASTIIPPPCRYSTAAPVSLAGRRYHLASSVAPSAVVTSWSVILTSSASGCA
jgi:hypothetical protein